MSTCLEPLPLSDEMAAHFERAPISQSLLYHDALLSPRLIQRFGEIVVVPLSSRRDGEVYERTSQIRQKQGGLLLDAELRLSGYQTVLAVFEQMVSGSKPFGQLLEEGGYEAVLGNQQFFVEQGAGDEMRLGRRHDIKLSDRSGRNMLAVAEVRELLCPEQQLYQASLVRSNTEN